MARCVRDLPISKPHDLCTLNLHEGAVFLGFGTLTELHSNFAVCWWIDDVFASPAPVVVWLCFSGDPLPEDLALSHLGSYLDNNSQPVRYFKGAHLFRVTGPPASCSRPT